MNEDAKKLVTENIGLAACVAKKYTNGNYDSYEDLFQTACEGLIIAAQKFDETKGLQFSTLAVAVMVNKVRNHFKVANKYERFDFLSFDYEYKNEDSHDNGTSNLLSLIDDDSSRFEDELPDNEMVNDLLSNLNENEKSVIKLTYGIGCEPAPQRAIGNLLGLSQPYIGRIKTKSLLIMKQKYLEWCGGGI